MKIIFKHLSNGEISLDFQTLSCITFLLIVFFKFTCLLFLVNSRVNKCCVKIVLSSHRLKECIFLSFRIHGTHPPYCMLTRVEGCSGGRGGFRGRKVGSAPRRRPLNPCSPEQWCLS